MIETILSLFAKLNNSVDWRYLFGVAVFVACYYFGKHQGKKDKEIKDLSQISKGLAEELKKTQERAIKEVEIEKTYDNAPDEYTTN